MEPKWKTKASRIKDNKETLSLMVDWIFFPWLNDARKGQKMLMVEKRMRDKICGEKSDKTTCLMH